MPKIVTHCEWPPIPIRSFDYCAHYDDPEGPTGWGATEAEAVNDLLTNYPPPCVDCDGHGGMDTPWGHAECATCEGSGERCIGDIHDPIIFV